MENHVGKLFHSLELFKAYMYCLMVLQKGGISCLNMFPVKSLSNTRWESRIKSVTTRRYQATELRPALPELRHGRDVEPKDITIA
jgi:hypothetical protein